MLKRAWWRDPQMLTPLSPRRVNQVRQGPWERGGTQAPPAPLENRACLELLAEKEPR